TKDMVEAYTLLFQRGIAESIEVWDGEELVGGLYGVTSGNVFCGESMFAKVSNASKLALIYQCRSGRYKVIDCQLPNDRLLSMGAEMIDRDLFLQILQP
ncbi:MAG: leucyl/phenylalanyl-tRNA--protein transferase, partial [Sphingobacteriales bacterium]